MRKPLAIDLYCGLGGWASGLLAEGYDVTGYDIEEHVYGEHRYPARLVIQDVLTLHGSQLKDAALIVASPPCQEYSYMAMPWKRAKAKAAAIRADETGAELERLNRLFNACFRIQREANEANGVASHGHTYLKPGECLECDGTGNFYRRDEDGDFLPCDHCGATGRPRRGHIPLIVENVRGAQPWVGRARGSFGSFYLWGDVPALMFTSRDCGMEGRKGGGDWFGSGENASLQRRHGSKSSGRKMAAAMIAKIPEPLSRHIARTYLPRADAA